MARAVQSGQLPKRTVVGKRHARKLFLVCTAALSVTAFLLIWVAVIQYRSTSRVNQAAQARILSDTQPTIATRMAHTNFVTDGIVLFLLAVDWVLILMASRHADKAAKLQLDFVASTSHELLTPLTAIYCAGKNARDGLLQTKSDWFVHGSVVSSQARRLIDLVNQNLLFAASESGMNRFAFQPLTVSEILQSVDKNLAALVEENGAVIERKIEANLPGVMGDLSALTQCVQNLVGNAIKYSGPNGHIVISAELCHREGHSNEIRISVRDHGPGISSSELRDIFKPFYRSPKAVQSRVHGTGLGLAVAERVAHAMKGQLSVSSEVGVGSIFTLHLPAHEADTGLQMLSPRAIEPMGAYGNE